MSWGSIAYIVDWAFVSRGAPWVEPAQMIPWLLAGGHSPREAEAWLSRFPAWQAAAPSSIDHYARLHTAAWIRRSELVPAAWIKPYLADVTRWARHRGAL